MRPTYEEICQMAIERGCIEGTAEYYGFIEGAERVRGMYEMAALKDRLHELLK